MALIRLERVSSGYVNNTTLKVKLMKRLLIALAAVVAVSTASAIITDTQLFETSHDFEADVPAEDSSALTAYESGTQPSFTAPYPCGSYGDNYLKLDTGDATLWRTNASESATIYFDMAIQFTPTAAGDEPDPTGNKIVVFMDADTNIVVISGTDATDHTPVTNRFPSSSATFTVAPKSWARLTIAAVRDNDALRFNVLVNENPLQRSFFYSLDSDTLVREVGLSGSGAVDDFVARTTDPLLSSWSATIGPGEGEKYSIYDYALVDALAATTADEAITITLTDEEHTTMDGSAANPYQIPNAACLMALQDAVLANPAVRSLNFVQTADIDMDGVEGFYGIGWYGSTDEYASLPPGVSAGTTISFAGTYDGAGYTISNVTLVRHNYAGLFNHVSGTLKNLTVQNIYFSGSQGECGCGIVGNASDALLENLTSAGTAWGWDAENRPNDVGHNSGGIACRADGNTIIRYCENYVDILSGARRLGGIVGFTGTTAANKAVNILCCTNNGNITSTYAANSGRGVGGIIASPETAQTTNTVISGCANFGTLTANEGNPTGAIVGTMKVNTNSSFTDGGGNTFLASAGLVGARGSNTKAIAGLAYAIDAGIDGANYLTTVAQADLAAGNTYTLLANVAASETPVYTFDAAGTIAFETNTYTFAGTVTSSNPMVDVSSATADGVITYTAAAGTVVATITKGEVTTSYSTLQKALAAAESGDTVNLVGAASGAVNIPAGITVQLVNGYSLNDVTSLAGEGVLAMPSGAAPQSTVQLLCQQSTWAGTLYIHDVDIGSAINLTLLGNANSTVRFNNAGCAFTTGSTTAHAIKALEIGPNGLDFVGNYSAGTFTFPCALTGTGMLKIAAKDSAYGTDHKVAKFTGDVSDFAGSISFDADANCAVYFGEAAGNGNCISVAAGSAVTVAAGKTWTAPSGFVVQGNMTVNGTLNAGSEKLYGNGTITFNAATSLIVANTWTGTYNANFKAANDAIFYIPVNASATTVINGANGEFGGYPKFGSGAPTVAGPVTLNANWTVANGWTGTGYTTTFAKLSGSGDLTVDGTTSGTDPIYYTITELDDYTGTLGGNRGNFTIGHVNVADQPTNGARVVKTAIGANGSINDNVPLYVGGVDTTKTLTYDANGAEGAGFYYIESAPTPVTPEVTPSVSGTVDCGSTAAATAAADAINAAKATYIKAPADAELSSEAAATYAGFFDARADGNNVVVELNAAGTNALETTASAIAAQIVATDNLADILTGTRSISVTGAQPGFFYSVVYATTLSALPTAAEGNRMMANAAGEVPLAVPAPEANATTGFYRVLVNVKATDE